MPVIRMSPAGLARQLQRDAVQFPKQLKAGLKAGATRGKSLLARETPVYLGQMKASWRVDEDASGAQLTNTAPHAGIVEAGARPHPVSAEGMAALTRWAYLVLGLTEEDAARAAQAIAAKIRKDGQAGTFYVRDHLGRLRDISLAAVERVMGRHHRGGAGNG